MRHDMHLGAGDPGAVERLISGEMDARERALLEAWRRHGWRAARIDPLGLAPRERDAALDADDAPWLAPLATTLEAIYGGTLGWEFGHVGDAERRGWLAATAETPRTPAGDARARAARIIAETEAFEAATLKRLPTAKTFSLDGAEGFMALADAVIAGADADEVVIGGMHRGRLAQMALLFGKPLARIVAELKGAPDLPQGLGAASDVPYHLGWAGTRADGRRVWVAPHPSHLSIVAPVAAGRARARGAGAMCLLLHTDAAFAGQGVNLELMQLSGLAPYSVGGAIHIVLDNRIGFTTDAAAARTSRGPADAARAVDAPILHVNGEDPDACLRAAETALAWRARWASDIVVVLTAYRRRGHNEVDDPRFTQPVMQRAIEARPRLTELYAPKAGRPDLSAFRAEMDAAFLARPATPGDAPEAPGLAPDAEARMLTPPETGLDAGRAAALLARLGALPPDFAAHPKAAQALARRRAMAAGETPVDWAAAEALAFASLLAEGTPVRFSGQDAVRGAFSQRHLMLSDQRSGRRVSMLDGFGARAEVFDTPLIENAAVGFEYGLSVGDPARLVAWEAQFGDFLNVFQAMFDQFVTGGEDRWLLTSALTLLLPHGWDGGGPDHSTGHVERVLARCARANLHVVNASTPAQWFHLLRGQARAGLRKPMVAFTPKALLRRRDCTSPLAAFGGRFASVLGEATAGAERVVIASGKLAVLLDAEREAAGLSERVAIVRLERLHPFPAEALAAALSPAPGAELIFAQEEPENLGPWLWLDRRIERAAGRPARLVSRPAAASPAVGWRSWHDAEERAVIEAALGGMEMTHGR